jgi:hypothetical protein
LPNTDKTKGKWKVEWSAPVKLQFDATATANGTVGTWIDMTVGNDDKTTVITFTQTEKVAADSQNS